MRLFEQVHPGGVSDNVGNHPNAFMMSSVQYLKDVEKNKTRKGGETTNENAAADVEMS